MFSFKPGNHRHSGSVLPELGGARVKSESHREGLERGVSYQLLVRLCMFHNFVIYEDSLLIL